jgi:hypothetical protein
MTFKITNCDLKESAAGGFREEADRALGQVGVRRIQQQLERGEDAIEFRIVALQSGLDLEDLPRDVAEG